MSLRDAPNVNVLWGTLVVEELVRNGVRTFVVAPGSRSTPLVQAIARHPEAEAVVWLDERGAGFYALGYGRSGIPAAVVTTSGTAVANLLPAVVEASLDAVPMILLTADRPHELREVGANQSIRQTGLFSDHVRWAIDLPAPGDDTPARMVLTTVDHAVQRAVQQSHPGPVQINCPFREPLAPDPAAWDAACLEGLEAWEEDTSPFTWVDETIAAQPLDAAWLQSVAAALAEARSGLVVLGGDAEAWPGAMLGTPLGWPVWRDARCAMPPLEDHGRLMPHVDRLLGNGFEPEVVLQLGARPTSRRLQAWIDAGSARDYVVVDPSPVRLDPGHRVTRRFVAPVDHWVNALGDALDEALDTPRELPESLAARHAALEEATEAAVEAGDALTEPWVARHLTRVLDQRHVLFVSNSMPIRDVQTYGVGDRPQLTVVANRGASGIDGIVSTAAGCALGARRPVTLLIGDVALLHDVNALAMLGSLEYPLTIVVLNNGGGSIFSFLPIAEHEDVLTPLVNTPHGITFDGICASFGLPYARAETRAAFEALHAGAVESGESSVVEVVSSLDANVEHHRRIEAAIERVVETT